MLVACVRMVVVELVVVLPKAAMIGTVLPTATETLFMGPGVVLDHLPVESIVLSMIAGVGVAVSERCGRRCQDYKDAG